MQVSWYICHETLGLNTKLVQIRPASKSKTKNPELLEIKVESSSVPVTSIIKEVLAELQIDQPTVKDKGRIMKTLMPRVKGKADGGLVNQVLGSFFA